MIEYHPNSPARTPRRQAPGRQAGVRAPPGPRGGGKAAPRCSADPHLSYLLGGVLGRNSGIEPLPIGPLRPPHDSPADTPITPQDSLETLVAFCNPPTIRHIPPNPPANIAQRRDSALAPSAQAREPSDTTRLSRTAHRRRRRRWHGYRTLGNGDPAPAPREIFAFGEATPTTLRTSWEARRRARTLSNAPPGISLSHAGVIGPPWRRPTTACSMRYDALQPTAASVIRVT